MQMQTKLTQEMEEATDLIKKILASTENLLEQRRSLLLYVPEPVSDSDNSMSVSEEPDSPAEAPGQYVKRA